MPEYRYAFLGVHWHTNVALPGLEGCAITTDPPESSEAPVTIELGTDATLTPPAAAEVIHDSRQDGEGVCIWSLPSQPRSPGSGLATRGGSYWYEYADGTRFEVDRDGSTVKATWPASLTAANASTYLTGPVAGLVLRLRGATLLHASAVRVSDGCVLFMGPSGSGKSTLAGALAARGYPIVTDDICLLRKTTNAAKDNAQSAVGGASDPILVCPGFPRISLWPESGEALYGERDALPPLVPRHATFAKRFVAYPSPVPTLLPLRAVYCGNHHPHTWAAPHNDAEVIPVPSQSALVRLAGNAYADYVMDAAMRAADFQLFSEIAANVPMRELQARRDFDALTHMVDVVEADIRQVTTTSLTASSSSSTRSM